MYVLHFYASSHKEELLGELSSAVEAGLPVFITECALSESSGDGPLDFASAAEWFTYLNRHRISYAVWNLSNKDESSAFFVPGFDPGTTIRDSDLTASGFWVRELIRGADPKAIPVSSPVSASFHICGKTSPTGSHGPPSKPCALSRASYALTVLSSYLQPWSHVHRPQDIYIDHPEKTAKAGIEAFRQFLISLGMPKNFEEPGAKKEDIPRLVHTLCYSDGRQGSITGIARNRIHFYRIHF